MAGALAARLAGHDVKQPIVTIEEARRADILICSALAMMECETGIPQRNIFGCDFGPQGGRPPYCNDDVTPGRVQALLDSGKANGVGWTQLTYRPFVVEAQSLGGAHIPRFQMRVGFKVLRQNFEQLGSVREMFRAYNGTGSAAQAYADRAMKFRSKWAVITEGR